MKNKNVVLAFCILVWIVYKYMEVITLAGFFDGRMSAYEYAIQTVYYYTCFPLMCIEMILVYNMKKVIFEPYFLSHKILMILFIVIIFLYICIDSYLVFSLQHEGL